MGKCTRCKGTGRIPDLLGGMSGGYRCDSCDDGEVPDGPADEVRAPEAAWRKGRDSYLVRVDPNRTLAEMIAAGGYVYANKYITAANFPHPPKRRGDVRVELVHFNRRITTASVESGIAGCGLRPADIWVALALAERSPDLQQKFPLVALGSSWKKSSGRLLFPCLSGSSGCHDLNLSSRVGPSDEWHKDCRFLAVLPRWAAKRK